MTGMRYSWRILRMPLKEHVNNEEALNEIQNKREIIYRISKNKWEFLGM